MRSETGNVNRKRHRKSSRVASHLATVAPSLVPVAVVHALLVEAHPVTDEELAQQRSNEPQAHCDGKLGHSEVTGVNDKCQGRAFLGVKRAQKHVS